MASGTTTSVWGRPSTAPPRSGCSSPPASPRPTRPPTPRSRALLPALRRALRRLLLSIGEYDLAQKHLTESIKLQPSLREPREVLDAIKTKLKANPRLAQGIQDMMLVEERGLRALNYADLKRARQQLELLVEGLECVAERIVRIGLRRTRAARRGRWRRWRRRAKAREGIVQTVAACPTHGSR